MLTQKHPLFAKKIARSNIENVISPLNWREVLSYKALNWREYAAQAKSGAYS